MAELTLEQWKKRALRAEGAVFHALWMRPLAYNGETAQIMTDRFHQHMESVYPDLVTRYGHRPVSVVKWADHCDCVDDGSNEYENDHSEYDGNHFLCSRSPLGRICESCEDEDGNGPEWKSYAVLWPCPTIAELNSKLEVTS